MHSIDPERLRMIRGARRWSQAKLAEKSGISPRQIVRLEKASEPTGTRAHTATKLANALDVDMDVLAGRAPVPDGLTVEEESAVITPTALAAVRRQRDLSRRQLGEASRVPEQRIQKLEAGTDPARIPKKEAGRLARALRVKESVLAGEEQLDEPPLAAETGVSMKTTPALRLAYDLVERRYGATSKDLYVLAPLLFVLLAEGSLESRRRKLDMARQASETLEKLSEENPTLYFGKRQAVVRQGIEEEQASIDARDVRGRQVWDSEWSAVHDFPEDDTNITPFADYLEDLAEQLDKRGGVVNFDNLLLVDQGLDPWGTNPYQVCRDELMKVVAARDSSEGWQRTSEMAQAALEWGDVRLSEIPEVLMGEDAWAKRLHWLESELSEDARQYVERTLEWRRIESEIVADKELLLDAHRAGIDPTGDELVLGNDERSAR